MSLVAVTFTLDQLEEYYRRCMIRNAVTVEDKNRVLKELIEEGSVTGVTVTNRTKDKYIADLAKQHGVVLKIGGNPSCESSQ